MDQIQALWAQFGSAHPIYSHALALFIGVFAGPKLVAWAEEKGIQKFIDWADEHQEVLLRRAGLSTEQLNSVREHEAADLRRAADEIDRKLKEEIKEAANAVKPLASS